MKKIMLIIIYIIYITVSLMSLQSLPGGGENVDKGQERPEARRKSTIRYSVDSSLGIGTVPASMGSQYTAQYDRYTQVTAPNGKAIHIVAQNRVSNEQIVRARKVLEHFLTDYAGSQYGSNKDSVADKMADNNAILLLLNGSDDGSNDPTVEGQALYQDELVVEGSDAYINNDYENHRDATFEEILHLVHDYGFGVDGGGNTFPGALPGYQSEIRSAQQNALDNNIWGMGAPDWIQELQQENSLTQEYLAAVIDSYYGLWGAYTGSSGMWGLYTPKTRNEIQTEDPMGWALTGKYFQPYLTYNARIDAGFSGTFYMSYDSGRPYTHKSQYLKDVTLTGSGNTKVKGNGYDNNITGNSGTNTVIYTGNYSGYTVTKNGSVVTVKDNSANRDGTDTLAQVEYLQFSDKTVAVADIGGGGGGGGGSGDAQIALSRADMVFTATVSGTVTGPQSFLVTNSGSGSLNWTASTDRSWLSVSPTSGSDPSAVTVTVTSPGTVGNHTGTVSVSDTNAGNSPQTLTVQLTVFSDGTTALPFGSFATPIGGTTVSGSVAVTGWVLDDIGVNRVEIWSEINGTSVFVDNAQFVEGARPDIETAFPQYPANYKAGWGYMMLTHFLPGGGNGTYDIRAVAVDEEGNRVTLGTKTVNIDNASSVKPFGAIDTPTQGGTVSGTAFTNFGWVLTPEPNIVPTNGSTIDVILDGVKIGNAAYNLYRSDIAGFFPGYLNANGAGGYFTIDTTAYDNGVHTIQWTVTDSDNNTDGIGSRFFTIQNSGKKITAKPFRRDVTGIPTDDTSPVRIKKGFEPNKEPQLQYPDENGNIIVAVKETEPLEIHLPMQGNAQWQITKPLIGSTMDAETGIFYWSPGPGFVGNYRLIFVKTDNYGNLTRKNIEIVINSAF